jgi:hypothetical protein
LTTSTRPDVLKEENRSAAEVVAIPGNGYNEPGTVLDPESLSTILAGLREVFA